MIYLSRDQIFVKGYDFFLLLKIWAKILQNLSKNLGGKYSQKLLDQTKQSAADALKTSSKRVIQKTAEATGDLICNKIFNRITKVSRGSKPNNSERYT